MEREKLMEFNEWWLTNKVPEELLEEYKRDLFRKIIEILNKRQIIAILGLRRTGKTTLMYQVIDYLLKKVKKENVLYFSFDETIRGLDDMINTYREITNVDFRKEIVFIFLDEIQKLNNWQNQIKKYYDLYPKIKFIISGSESLFIEKRIKETLAGRMYELLLNTLSFKEFLGIRKIDAKKEHIIKIKALFREYIEKGGFPEIAKENDLNEIKRYVRSSVIDKIIYKDILKLSGIKDADLLITILEILASSPGMYLEYSSLAQQLDRDRRTIREYVMWLKNGFLITILGNFRKGRLASIRKTKRIYMSDNGIITAYKPSVDDAFFGRMVENAIVNSLNAKLFWKNQNEVDVIWNETPIEVKYRSKIIMKDLSGLREFMKKFKKRKGILITKDEEKKIRLKEGTINCIPAWQFLLNPIP